MIYFFRVLLKLTIVFAIAGCVSQPSSVDSKPNAEIKVISASESGHVLVPVSQALKKTTKTFGNKERLPSSVKEEHISPSQQLSLSDSYVIKFEKSSSTVSSQQVESLLAMVECAINSGFSTAEIAGYASRSGSFGFNKSLSDRRADAVIKIIKDKHPNFNLTKKEHQGNSFFKEKIATIVIK